MQVSVNGTNVTINTALSNYLPLAGGALTGDVTLATTKKLSGVAELNLNAATGNNVNLQVNSSNIAQVSSSGLATNAISSISANDLAFNVATSQKYTWSVNGSEKMRLHASAGLSLGTTLDPTAGFLAFGDGKGIKVDVNGTLRTVLTYIQSSTALQIGSSSVLDTYLDSGSAGAIRFRVDGTNVQTLVTQTCTEIVRAFSKAPTSVNNTAYTILTTDNTIIVVSLSASRTMTLPALSAVRTGTIYTIMDGDGSCSVTNTIVIARAGSDQIAGATSKTLAAAWSGITIQKVSSTQWAVLATVGTVT